MDSTATPVPSTHTHPIPPRSPPSHPPDAQPHPTPHPPPPLPKMLPAIPRPEKAAQNCCQKTAQKRAFAADIPKKCHHFPPQICGGFHSQGVPNPQAAASFSPQAAARFWRRQALDEGQTEIRGGRKKRSQDHVLLEVLLPPPPSVACLRPLSHPALIFLEREHCAT